MRNIFTFFFLFYTPLLPAQAGGHLCVQKDIEARITQVEQSYLNTDSVALTLKIVLTNLGRDSLYFPLSVPSRDHNRYETWKYFTFSSGLCDLDLNRVYLYDDPASQPRSNRLGCTICGRTRTVYLLPGEQMEFTIKTGLNINDATACTRIHFSFEKGDASKNYSTENWVIPQQNHFDLDIVNSKKTRKQKGTGILFKWLDQSKIKYGDL